MASETVRKRNVKSDGSRRANKLKEETIDEVPRLENIVSEEQDDFENMLDSLKPEETTYFLTRIVLLRFLAFIYGVAFLIAYHQNIHLIGKNGLKPANQYMKKIFTSFKERSDTMFTNPLINSLGDNFKLFLNCPTFFWFFDWTMHIDELLNYTSILGLLLSGFIFITGAANSVLMFTLWILYHSLVNIGQTWYSFGWESQLLESGFISIFMVPLFSLRMMNAKSPPSFVSILLFRWLIVRIMLGAGLIKIRGDQCWRDFTCMNYFYETQPVPNPLSYFQHNEPEQFHKFEVLANHFVELVAPCFILIPFRSMRIIGGIIQIKFQLILICSGNLSFLNWLTILPSLACFDDRSYAFLFNKKNNSYLWQLLRIQFSQAVPNSKLNIELSRRRVGKQLRQATNILLSGLILYLSWPVISNLISPNQAMNTSFEPFRIVNTYGAFGSVTKERNEVIFMGTQSPNVANHLEKPVWHEYEFKCKPGDVNRRPCVISPYHYRLDWLMWFSAFQSYEYNPWLLSLAAKFLLNDEDFTRQMISKNPFENKDPPRYIRADLYLYKYSPMGRNHSAWWTRKYVRSYLPPVTIYHLKSYMEEQLGWDLKSYQHIFN